MPVTHKPPFDLPELDWRPVSPKLVTVKLISQLIAYVLIVGALATVALLTSWQWLWWVAGALFAWGLLNMLLIPRRVRAIGYAERAEDLLLREGLLVRNLMVVPYGRMQYVEVSSGPLLRRYGLATVELKTAAGMASIEVPGLPAEQAEQLRDHLAVLGESRMAGL